MPFTPLLGIGFSLWLMSRLPALAWARFLIWLGVGLAIYFFYGRRHSLLNEIQKDAGDPSR